MAWRDRLREALCRERTLPTLRLPGTLAWAGVWVGVGAPALTPSAGERTLMGPVGEVALLFATPQERVATDPPEEARTTFAEVVEAARLAWSRQDAPGIIATSRPLLLQLPGADAWASVGRDQAIRLVEGFLQRSEAIAVRVQTSREVGPGQGYAELVRQYRVTGTDEVRSQRILLAFREALSRGGWELVELRVLQAGG